MAREWAEVPEYVTSLEQHARPDRAPEFLRRSSGERDEMRATVRALFERWIDRVVG
jgi:hypothetical protein